MSGVISTRTGYMGGTFDNPTYHKVCTKTTGHAEVVEVTFDPELTSLEALLKGFFSFHDATQDRRGKGGQYRSVVFWRKQEEYVKLASLLESLQLADLEVSTSIEKAGVFWEAEPRHQGYVARTGRKCDLVSTTDLERLTIEDIVRAKAT